MDNLSSRTPSPLQHDRSKKIAERLTGADNPVSPRAAQARRPQMRRGGMKMSVDDWRRFSTLLALIRAGRGVGPSVSEIGATWGLSGKSLTHKYLVRLREHGLIWWIPAKARSIEVARFLAPVPGPDGAVLLPLTVVSDGQ